MSRPAGRLRIRGNFRKIGLRRRRSVLGDFEAHDRGAVREGDDSHRGGPELYERRTGSHVIVRLF